MDKGTQGKEFREVFPEGVTFSQTFNSIIQFGVLGSFFQLPAKFPCDLELLFAPTLGSPDPFKAVAESFGSQPPLRRVSESQSPSG